MDVAINGKVVGKYEVVAGKLTYVTHRDSTKHFFIREKGYGVSVSILQTLLSKGVHRILILETRKDGSKHSYEGETLQFAKQVTIQEENYDAQKILPITEMKEIL